MHTILQHFCPIAVILTVACTSPVSEGGGGGTETTNALAVVADGLTVYGYAPEGSVVALYNSSFNPLGEERYFDSAVVDSGKTFQLKQVSDDGTYNIFVTNKPLHSGATISFINLQPEKRDSIFVPFETLGSISGTVSIGGEDTNAPAGGIYVYCEGTGNFAQTDSFGEFAIENIPVGTYRVKMFNQPASGPDAGEKIAIVSNRQPIAEVKFILEGGQ